MEEKMFSTPLALPHTLFQGQSYTPHISSLLSSSPLKSSPLSPRDGNVPTRQFSMSSPTPTSRRQHLQFSKRHVKANPMIHNRSDGREARRNLFLRKVRESSEDRRWEVRGGDEAMMRTIWVAEEKRRIERQHKEAAYVSASQEEDEAEREPEQVEEPLRTALSQDEEMADELALQEDAELEALLAMMETQSTNDPPDVIQTLETLCQSDEDEYDTLFMDVIVSANEIDNGTLNHNSMEKPGQVMDTAMDRLKRNGQESELDIEG